MSVMVKISILSDSPFFPTGYSNQAKLLARYLKDKGHEIQFMANGFTGATIKNAELMDGTKFDYTIIGQEKQPYFADVMSPMIKKHESDFFLILLDTFMLHGGNGWFLNIDTSPAQTAFWFPSDGGGGMPVKCESILRKTDHPVAMAKFGQKQVKDYYNIDTKFIPHGTEPEKFYRLPDEERNQLRASKGLHDKFVIGVVARNQSRKMLDRTIKTLFSMMNKVKTQIPNAVLYLHMDQNDPAKAVPLDSLIKRYNLENRVIYTGVSALKGFDWSEMNNVYNVMDCMFLSTSGEGFGIPMIEAMSCEVPVVATSYTTTHELVEHPKSGFGVKLVGCDQLDFFKMHAKDYDNALINGTFTGGWEVERGLIDVDHAAEQIHKLWSNPKLCREMGENGRKEVLEKYDFEKIVGPAWEKLILNAVK